MYQPVDHRVNMEATALLEQAGHPLRGQRYPLFLPRIRKAPGFIDAKLLKFRKANVGTIGWSKRSPPKGGGRN